MYDVEIFVYKFTKLKAATRLCMYVHRVYVYVYEFTEPNVATRVCMYVVRIYVYGFTELNATTHKYVIHKFYDKRCLFSVFKVTVKIAITTIGMDSTC